MQPAKDYTEVPISTNMTYILSSNRNNACCLVEDLKEYELRYKMGWPLNGDILAYVYL